MRRSTGDQEERAMARPLFPAQHSLAGTPSQPRSFVVTTTIERRAP